MMNLQKALASPGSRLRDITLSALNVSRASRKSQRWIETKFKVIVSWVSCGDINNNKSNTPHLGAPRVCAESSRGGMNSEAECSLMCLLVCQDFWTNYTEKLQINRDVLIMAWCVPGCEQEQDLLWDPDIVTGVENQYWAGISLSRHQPFSRVQGWTGPCDHFNISAPRRRGDTMYIYL